MIKTANSYSADADRDAKRSKRKTFILSLLPPTPQAPGGRAFAAQVAQLEQVLDELPAATRRMLDTALGALRADHDLADGLRFWEHADRADIAASMGKPVLVPYDVEKLRKLAAAGLLVETYQPLPRRGGGEFVYTVAPDVLPALLLAADPAAFDARRAAIAAGADQERQRADQERAARIAADPELQLAADHQFEDFETATHVFLWDQSGRKHIKRRKTFGQRLASRFRRYD